MAPEAIANHPVKQALDRLDYDEALRLVGADTVQETEGTLL
jgi:hypothetical protein